MELLPGGVNSPVRAMRAIGRDPIFVARGEGAEIVDVDGNRYVDYVCSWGPLIAGHAHPAVVAAVCDAAERGTSFGGISHCYQRPTYEDWPYSVFTMAHGRSKEECDAILDSIAEMTDLHGDDRATLYSSTEYKKIRLHYFTPDYAEWEKTHSR